MRESIRKGPSQPACIRVAIVVCGVLATLVLGACSGAAPAPIPSTPVVAPSTAAAQPAKATEPAKAAEPTKSAPTAAPTAVPAKKVEFPEKGKAITLLLGWPAGGTADSATRLVAQFLEQELGVPVQVVNKAGATTQIAMTDLAKAKPDGYTIGMVSMGYVSVTYFDAERKATYSRKDFAPIALQGWDFSGVAVRADGPYKTAKDLLDAAKANPEKVRMGNSSFLGTDHLMVLLLESIAGVRFAQVKFDGAPGGISALLGGHIDAFGTSMPVLLSHYKSGTLRILGVADKQRSKFFPDVPTLEEQGYKVYFPMTRGLAAPAGTPKEIIDIISAATRRAMEKKEFTEKADSQALELRYMDAAGFDTHWAEIDAVVKTLMPLAREQQQ